MALKSDISGQPFQWFSWPK